jgi:signal peptidase I
MDNLALRATDEAGSTEIRPRSRGAHAAPKGAKPAPKPGRTRSKGDKKESGRHRRLLPERPFWKELPILIVVAIVVAWVVKSFLLQVFFIPSGSMENTLRINDRVLVDKLSYDFRDIKRGEIVVFNADGVLAPENSVVVEPANPVSRAVRTFASAIGLAPSSETDYIKRVIGLPGDRVTCCDDQGRMSVNGVPLDETAYLFPGDAPSALKFDVTVPDDRLWVMGDHRSASQDSRSKIGAGGGGFIPVDRVVGRAFVITWPFDNISRLTVPETFDQPLIDQQKGTTQ